MAFFGLSTTLFAQTDLSTEKMKKIGDDREKIWTNCPKPVAFRGGDLFTATEWDIVPPYTNSKTYPNRSLGLHTSVSIVGQDGKIDPATSCDYLTIKFNGNKFVSLDQSKCMKQKVYISPESFKPCANLIGFNL